MNEAVQYRMVKILYEERLKRAERARLLHSAVIHRASSKAAPTKAPRAMCRRSGQAAY